MIAERQHPALCIGESGRFGSRPYDTIVSRPRPTCRPRWNRHRDGRYVAVRSLLACRRFGYPGLFFEL